MLPTSLIHCIISGAQSKYRGPHVSCCKKCNKMCRTHIIYFSIKFIFHLKREMDLCSLEMTLFCSRRYLPLLQFIRWWCQITEPDIFIIWRRCEENKPLQAHTEKSLMIEMMTGYGAWCHTNVCGLVRHTGRLRYLCISAEGFFG